MVFLYPFAAAAPMATATCDSYFRAGCAREFDRISSSRTSAKLHSLEELSTGPSCTLQLFAGKGLERDRFADGLGIRAGAGVPTVCRFANGQIQPQ